MKKVNLLMMAIFLLFAMSMPTQTVAQNKKLLKEATQGSGGAQALLSGYYYNGTEGFEKDIKQAEYWADRAMESAKAGSWEAQMWITARFFYGDQCYKKNIHEAKTWADITLKNKDLVGREREIFVTFNEKVVKEYKEELEAEQKMKTPEGMAEKIIQLIDDKNQPFSEVVSMTDNLLAMEKTDEQKQAVRRVIKECQMEAFSDRDTERGRQENLLAEKLWEHLIEGGDVQEMIDYANNCRYNDTEKAKKYFQQAADKGDARAISGLASCYEDENNKEKAIEWYIKLLKVDASEQYAIEAMNYFRKINRSDLILKALEMTAAAGNRDGMLRVGDIYRNGHDWSFKKTGITVKKNYATAIKWYKKAHDAGSKASLFFMADCYWKGGNGITQNRAQAGKLYQQMMDEASLFSVRISEAEPEERSVASYQFGYCLENGLGVVKNMNRAWNFYCDSNEADAYYRRAVMLERKWVKERLRPDYRKQECRQLYQMAANKGHAQAKQALNRMYR